MNFELKSILKTLGLPIALVLIISGALSLLGLSLVQIEQIASSLVGLSLLVALVINIGKWGGVVDNGTAGYWSAMLNLLALASVGVALYFDPEFDFAAVDAQLGGFARVAGVVFIYMTQFISSKQMHVFMTNNLNLRRFSHSLTLSDYVAVVAKGSSSRAQRSS